MAAGQCIHRSEGRRRQVIKETNLFFALPALLGLFPDSPVAVLTRSPLGVASSFAHGDLFRRWDYRARYQQMTAMTTRQKFAAWAGVVPDDDPPDLAALARLQILNTLLLASALHRCRHADHDGQPFSVTAAEITQTLRGWIRSLTDRDRPLRELDETLAQALTSLQADRGLRPHVGAGTGEPRRD